MNFTTAFNLLAQKGTIPTFGDASQVPSVRNEYYSRKKVTQW